MVGNIARDRIIARFTLEKVKQWILSYEGEPEGLKEFLLKKIEKYMFKADLLLADMLDELL